MIKIDLKHGVELMSVNSLWKLLINIKEALGSCWYIMCREIG